MTLYSKGVFGLRLRWPARPIRRRALVATATLLLSIVPLVGTLGYFSAFVLAVPLCLFAIGVGVDAVESLPPSPDTKTSWPAMVAVLRASGRELVWLGGLPFAILVLAQLWNRNCDPWGGVLWFLIGPACSMILGCGCGIVAAAFGRSRRVTVALAATPFVFCTSVALWRLYVDPVVYAYDPFWGYFSGPLYDESVSVTPRYWWFRGYNLLCAAAVASLLATVLTPGFRIRFSAAALRRSSLGLGLALAVLGGWFGLRGDQYGFTTTLESTKRKLSMSRETEHFVIHFAPRSATSREIDDIAAEHEFAWSRLAKIVGRTPEAPIHSFIFSTPADKRAIFGAGRVEVSLPWKGQIYLHHQKFPHRALHHELVHAFGVTFGDPVFGMSPAVGLIEGLANALAPRPAQGLDLHDQAAILDRLNLRPSVPDIVGLGFWAKPSSRAYTAVGSFCRWLIDTRGIENMMTLYGEGGEFEAVYGEELATLEQEWLTFLRRRPVLETDVAAMAQRFKRPAIFRRACAHRAAALRREARRAADRGDEKAAVSALLTLCEIEPERYQHRVALARELAETSQFERAREALLEAAGLGSLTESAHANIDELRGDIEILTENHASAREHYERGLGRDTSENRRRALQLKRLAATHPDLAKDLVEYFAPFDPDSNSRAGTITRFYAATRLRMTTSHAAIGSYLTAFQLLSAARPRHAVPLLERAIAVPSGDDTVLPGPALHRRARLLLVQARLRSGSFDAARAALDELLTTTQAPTADGRTAPLAHKSGHLLEYDWWRQRIDFFEQYRATHNAE